jgi:hypothetical protein
MARGRPVEVSMQEELLVMVRNPPMTSVAATPVMSIV